MKNWGKVFVLIVCSIVIISSVILGGCMSQTRAARAEAKTFLTYAKYNQWDKAWEMLHPDCQSAWENQNTFINMMNSSSQNLIRFKLRKAIAIASWHHAGTDTSYSDVIEIPVSLIYSTTYGEKKRYQMIHTININGNWKFFQYPKE